MFIRSEALIMLKMVVINVPQTERLVAEMVRLISATGTITRELNLLKSFSVKKGSANARKSAANILAFLAHLGAQKIDRELVDSGVPKQLIYASASLPLFSPSLGVVWLHWFRKNIDRGGGTEGEDKKEVEIVESKNVDDDTLYDLR